MVDISKLRASERRLQSSSLFNVNPATGDLPRIVVKPPPAGEEEVQIADNSDTIRGQNPEPAHIQARPQPRVSYRPVINHDGSLDIIVNCPSINAKDDGNANGIRTAWPGSVQDAQQRKAIR